MAALLYLSGMTGQPKGVILSHGNLLSNITSLIDAWGFSEPDCLLHALPVYHVHGLFVAIVIKQLGLKLSEPEMIMLLKQRVASFKVPKRIVFIDELPRNVMGKVQKNKLREQFSF